VDADVVRRQAFIGEVTLTPDGGAVAYTRRTVLDDRDAVRILLVPWKGGRPRRLTNGPGRDTRPRVSPDGRQLAFLSDRERDVTQAYVLPLRGGEARRVTAFRRGVGDLQWTPDSRGLLVLAVDDDAPNRVGDRADGTPTARVVRRLDWREDGEGLLERPSHIHHVPLDGDGVPEARRLTSGSWSASRPLPGPEEQVLFLADRRDDGDLEPRPRIHAVPIDGGEPYALVVGVQGPIQRFAVEPDGGLILLAPGRERPEDDAPARVWHVAPDGAARCLTADVDRWLGQSGTESDLHDWHATFADAGRVTTLQDAGRVIPCRVGDGGLEELVERHRDPVANCLAAAGERVAAAMSLGGAAPELWALEPGRSPRRLTGDGEGWLPARRRPVVEELELDGPGGPVRTFLVSPPGAPRAPLPTILDVHGGPLGAWGPLPPLEAVLLAARGYRVALPNPRGSYDRGAGWVRGLRGDWGGADADDCHAVLDGLVERRLADPDRLGVIGLSYGGFMANWLVATSSRFRAAVSENGVVNQVSAWANSDCGPTYCEAAGLGDAVTPEGVDRLWRQSPLRLVQDIRTPLLLLQAEADLRCPPADAEQLFVALRWLRREVELVLYPEEFHAFQGTGRPDRRLDRHRRVLDWFARHLPAEDSVSA
jgi:dipeptidyl aminopeptidase/acylaminoacyl peptidase